MNRRGATVAGWAALAAVVVASAAAGRLCYLRRPFDSDAAMFAYMGRLTADGGRVGPDLIDNKYPTVGLMMTAAWRACGTRWPAYVGLGVAMSAVATAAVAVAARRGGGRSGPAAAFAAVLLNLTPVVNGGFQLETPIVCCTSVAAACGVAAVVDGSVGSAFAAGLAGGCGAMLKPTAAGVLAAVVVAAVVRRRSPWRTGLGVAAGLAVPAGVAAAYLSAADLWAELPAATRRLSAYADGSVVDAVTGVKLATAAAVLGLPFVVRRNRECDRLAGPLAGRACPRRGHGGQGRRPNGEVVADARSTAWTFALGWLAIEVVGVVAQRRMYAYHFLPIVPPTAVLFGLCRRPATPGRLLAGLGPIAALGLLLATRVTPADDRLPVGRYLAARAVPGDRVWADDCPRLLLETGLAAGARQPLTFLFANDDGAAAAGSAGIVADLDRRRPAFVVLPADLPRWLDRQTGGIAELSARPARAVAYRAGWDRIAVYVHGHYRQAAVIDGSAVYRRADDGTSTSATASW